MSDNAPPRRVAVIDIGKTNAKLAIVDIETFAEIGVLKAPNTVLPGPPYPHYDIAGLRRFLFGALGQLHAEHGFDAISVTTHGASGVLVDAAGDLATPMLDYEHPGPDEMAAAYDAIRPPFSETGSPRLPLGLNLGAQFHWLLARDARLADRVAHVVTYPQYWSGVLTGHFHTEPTSLGAHTDLWNPEARAFSSLVTTLGLANKMAPLARAGDRVGTVRPGIAAEAGIPAGLPVFSGIHDSNASLYPYLLRQDPPFAVVSTGTWVIAMAVGDGQPPLRPERDTLMNVNAMGAPVPSARFMGGREYEMVAAGRDLTPSDDDIASILSQNAFLLPSVDIHSGPFQGRPARWTVPQDRLSPGEQGAVLSFYLALMTAECLSMIGDAGPVIAEGPFTRNRCYLTMLAAATGREIVVARGSETGTSLGTALLACPGLAPPPLDAETLAPGDDPALADYAAGWRVAVAEG